MKAPFLIGVVAKRPRPVRERPIRKALLLAISRDRMPVILAPGDYAHWLGEEPDPRDVMRPFPSRADAHVADFDMGQQARERSPLDSRIGRAGSRTL